LTFRRKDGDGGDESEKEGGNLHHGWFWVVKVERMECVLEGVSLIL
jgi:hypothetical protein